MQTTTVENRNQEAFQIVNERLNELRGILFRLEDRYLNEADSNKKRYMVGKLAFIKSLIDLNQEIYDKLSKISCNSIH